VTLQDRLDRIRAGFEAQAPAAALEVMHRATRDLRDTGIAERAVREGQQAPDFRLKGSSGGEICLSEAHSSGPVVLTFFRGRW